METLEFFLLCRDASVARQTALLPVEHNDLNGIESFIVTFTQSSSTTRLR